MPDLLVLEPLVLVDYTIYHINMKELPDYLDKFGDRIKHIIHHLRHASIENSNCISAECVLSLIILN